MLTFEIVVVFVLILLNGFFAMAELAVVSARRARLQHAVERGGRGARGAEIALDLKRDPGRFLSTVQIGITVIGVLASTFGGATLSDSIAEYVVQIPGVPPAYTRTIAIGLVVIVISYLTLILGELVPKRLALSHPEQIASALAGFLRGMAKVSTPVEWFLSASSNLVLRLIPRGPRESNAVTEEEIGLMLQEGAAAGHFHVGETAIVQMALRLGDRSISAVMSPRTQVEWLDVNDSEEETRRKINESPYSRFPVVDGGPQQMVGIVQVKELLSASLAGKPLDLRAMVKPPLYLPNTVTALRALEIFKKSGEPLAIVIDEYGDFEGIVTLNDILQSLVGDIAAPGDQEDPAIVQREDGSWLVDGMTTIDEVKDLLSLTELPGDDSGDFHTLGGFLMARLNRVPSVADYVTVNDFRFEVVDMDGRRVDRVLIAPEKREA